MSDEKQDMTQVSSQDREIAIVAPDGVVTRGITCLPVLTPTLPPATHTNVYILGDGDLVVVDPASPYPEERAVLREAVGARLARGERLAAIFLTHQHLDHVSGAVSLKRAFSTVEDVPIWAHPLTAARLTGRLPVDHLVAEGDLLPAGGVKVEALLTPGHAPGHLCLLDHASRSLVCGDMVASVGTILIDADDDGDMAVYLDSLERLRALRARCLLPSHGPPIWNADQHLGFYIEHRLMRERKVLAALDEDARPLDQLVPRAYDDVDPAVYALAKRSLRAHLDKLVRESKAERDANGWKRAG